MINDPAIFTECELCWGEIQEGDIAVEVEEGFLHDDCFNEYARNVYILRTIDPVTKEDCK